MIVGTKKFFTGLGLLLSFVILMAIIFSPVFHGRNGLEYMDSLYNSISKGSAHYIPELIGESAVFKGSRVTVNIRMDSEIQAQQTLPLFEKGGAEVETAGDRLRVTGDLGRIFENCLEDSEMMYHNEANHIESKYHLDGRRVLYNWYKALKAMEKELNDHGRFKEADMVTLILEKAVECSYNFYNIEPLKISESTGIVIFSLLFYVIYTVWYGFAFMFMFEGWGMRLEH